MSTYRAIILATGDSYEYQADAPMAWDGMSSPDQHILVPAASDAQTTMDVVPPKITKLAFDNRFTLAELTGIEMASIDDPSASVQRRTLASSLRIMMRKQQMETCIDFAQPDAAMFLQVLVGVGLLDSHRPSQILSPVVQDKEVWRV